MLVLAAFSGIAQESMTRSHAWRFLDVGRRLERAIGLVRLLRHTLAEAPPSSADRPAALLEALLEVADSGITYRRRYLATLQVAPVLDLLLTDDGNPRSLVFQLEALSEHWQALGAAGAVLAGRPGARSGAAAGRAAGGGRRGAGGDGRARPPPGAGCAAGPAGAGAAGAVPAAVGRHTCPGRARPLTRAVSVPQQRDMAAPPERPSAKKVHIKTFGCQMNAYDSERMADALAPSGYALTRDPEEADLVILNTCHIREKAAEKVYSELGRVRLAKARRKAEGRDTLVAVAGCVAQAEGREIAARAPVVDIVVGPQSYHRLPDLVAEAARNGGSLVATDFPAEAKFAHLPERPAGKAPASAFVTVQEGCDKFCTFCVVPYTRGAEFSRAPAEIVGEVDEACRARRKRDHAARRERQCVSRGGSRRRVLVAR